ncbi:minor allergen Alt a 7 [Colletotrichum abscissum]|uniref:Minor allergen Alt a 7 n=1 Tax=Colletotrichum tamarilloi TaxID=1209934 RepID=A0ABQ9RBJ8_9PEZI|nr:minor allergen Alt a 7 [Colletotrichum tamarilloi]XP_060391893.1 minor allergen Alt a 7 [Colletotrichum abscissum]KAK1476526.1 minor allergen Alt a 7 [Colletotrichum abscissum]KAK1500587.1 minor allergen Alt a 7 [Colletotrichum tamarilloi]
MAPKIAIVYYSMYGHIRQLAEAEKKGIEKAGGTADLFQVAETLPEEVLTKMGAPPKATDVPVLDDPATLESYDAFLLGIPTRYGNFPAQWKAFWDKSGKQWSTGGYWGKLAGLFISTASLGGGQESTAIAAMSTFAHHGIIYVPFGYAKAFPLMADLSEVHGGGPWGAGTFAGADGSRQPSAKELEIATIQGEAFYHTVAKHSGGATAVANGVNGSEKPAAAKADPAVPAAKEPAPATETRKAPQELDDKDVKAGPCGLPSKCVVQ